MPGNSALPSVLGNIVTQRQKLSAVRQRLSLEPTNATGSLSAIAPSPPNGPDMSNKGAAMRAGEAPSIDPNLFDPANNPIQNHPKYQQMAQSVQDFIDNNQNGIDDRAEPLQAQPAQPTDPAGGGVASGTVVNDPRMLAALTPLTNFFRQNGRLPSIDELRDMEDTRRELKEQGMV